MSRRVKCQEEIAKFLTLLEDDSDCEHSDPNSDHKFYFMDVNEMCAYNNFLYMAAVFVYSFSSTASKHNECIPDASPSARVLTACYAGYHQASCLNEAPITIDSY